MLVYCFEPNGQPKRSVLDLGSDKRLALFAIQDALLEEARGLRCTVMRHMGKSPPPKGLLILEAEIRRKRPNEAPTFRMLTIGRQVNIEWVRQDGRSRVTPGNEFKSGSRYEVTLPDMRTVIFSLEVAVEVKQGASATSGGRAAGKDDGSQGVAAGLWMVPAVATVLENPLGQAKGQVLQRLSKMGISPALLSPTIISVIFMAGAGFFAYLQYNGAQDAKGQLAEMEVQLKGAEAGRNAALIAEEACVQERESIAKALDNVHEARKLNAEVALAVPLAQALAVEVGGAKMATEDALAYDTVAVGNVHKLIVAEMGKKRPPLGDPERCLNQIAALGQDLPLYVLMWHPDMEFLCPENYSDADGAVARAGPWGLSTRIAAEFGSPHDTTGAASGFGDAPEDPRMNHRWSGHAVGVGLRDIVTTLLEADTGERPPVSPGQVNLWALALWDAYNRLASPADGAMDKTANECITELLDQVVKAQGPAKPGQPVLPDLSRFVMGEGFSITPNSHCPWPSDGLETGAKAAVEAVTRLAIHQMESED